MTRYFRCINCNWCEETSNIPRACPRCKGKMCVKETTKAKFLAAYDAGEVRFCEACQKVHTR